MGSFLKPFRIIILALIGIFLSACGGIKTSESVFGDSSLACGQGASMNRFIVMWEDGRYTVEEANSVEEFKENFVKKNLALIKHVDYDYNVQLINQDNISVLGGEENDSLTMNWGPQAVGAQTVWNQGYTGNGVKVGVVDGMVDTAHTQLAGNIAINTAEIPNNGIDDDHNGFVDDYKGVQVNSEKNNPSANRHGSHVSGIIVADPNLGPVSGMAPKAKVIPAQFIGNDGGGSIADAIVALNYVANRGAKIINMSWGLDSCVTIPSLQSTLQGLNNNGFLLVTAAGNGDRYGVGVNMDKNPAYPSAYNFLNQINVAASTTSNYLKGFSNYGQKTVHVAAPGVGIWSTVPNNNIEPMDGTSMAAPLVSGAAALLWEAVPTATAAQIKQAIISTVSRNSGSPLPVSSGGVINVASALTELKRITGK